MKKISALMDGELDGEQTELQLARLKRDPEARATWDTFHLIGSAMRKERAVSPTFAARFSERLAQEPTVLAPRAKRPGRATAVALSAAASVAAVAVVGGMALQRQVDRQPEGATPVAAASANLVPAEAPLANVPSDGRMNDYLVVHQEYSPSTAFQGVAPYVRTVSATKPAQE